MVKTFGHPTARPDRSGRQDLSIFFFDSSRGGFAVVLKTAPKTTPTTRSGIPAKTRAPSIVFTTEGYAVKINRGRGRFLPAGEDAKPVANGAAPYRSGR